MPETTRAGTPSQAALAAGEDGPHGPGMDARVTALEVEVGEMKSVLRQLEPAIARIDERTAHLVTNEQLESARSDILVKLASARSDFLVEVASARSDFLVELASARSGILVELATKATKGTVWTVGLTLASLVVAALATGAIYMPYLATLLRRTGQ